MYFSHLILFLFFLVIFLPLFSCIVKNPKTGNVIAVYFPNKLFEKLHYFRISKSLPHDANTAYFRTYLRLTKLFMLCERFEMSRGNKNLIFRIILSVFVIILESNQTQTLVACQFLSVRHRNLIDDSIFNPLLAASNCANLYRCLFYVNYGQLHE